MTMSKITMKMAHLHSASMFYHIYSTVHEKDFLKTNKPMADYSEYTAILQLQ